jgi:diaminopropionate ammonia-lyase
VLVALSERGLKMSVEPSVVSFRNPQATSGLVVGEPPNREALAFHRRLPGYAPTRLVHAPTLARMLDVRDVWVKDESSRFGLPSFKILGASWATYRALDARAGGAIPAWHTLDELSRHLEPLKPLTLVAATDGNHGRAVAHMARLLGLHAHILVPEGMAPARIEAIQGEGAAVTIVQGTYDDAVEQAAALASDRTLLISDTGWPGYEDVPAWVVEGYSTIFWEVDDQLAEAGKRAPDLVAVQMGVGALASAVVRQYRRPALETRPRIVGVEPTGAACVLASAQAGERISIPGPHRSIMAGLNCGIPSATAWPLVSQGIDLFVAIDDEYAAAAMRALAAAGVVSGETGAAGLGGLLAILRGAEAPRIRDELGVGQASSVLVLSTEGATDPEAYARTVSTRS